MDLLPLQEAAWNYREVVKQLCLLEDHLFHPRKRCDDCIGKHFLTAEALSEEALTLNQDSVSPEAEELQQMLPEALRYLLTSYNKITGGDEHDFASMQAVAILELAQQVRAIRKELARFYAHMRVAATNQPCSMRVAREFLAGRLSMGLAKGDARGTESLRGWKGRFPARSKGDLQGALLQAAHYAKKTGETMFGYAGNSFGSAIWRVSAKSSEYLDPINNTGVKVFSVTPDLELSWHDITR